MIQRFWGKLGARDEQGHISEQLSLVDHSIDVACVFRQLCEMPAIHRCLEHATSKTLNEVELDRLSVFALLHDIGKCNWGFQAKKELNAQNTSGHVRETLPLFFNEDLNSTFLQIIGFEQLSKWFTSQEETLQLLLVAISHHGRPAFSFSDRHSIDVVRLAKFWKNNGNIDPMVGLQEIITAAQHVFPMAYENITNTIPVTTALEHYFAGLVTLSDWIGSHREAFFPLCYQKHRDKWSHKQAKIALASIGIDISEIRRLLSNKPLNFNKFFGIDPYPLQKYLFRADLPPLLIAESETGSGKTEAALANFLALFNANKVDSLYFALPTRVAAYELYSRIFNIMKNIFGANCPPVLLAVPGYSQIDGEPYNVLPSELNLYHEKDISERERTWAAERPKRFLAAPIAVGTIDQALLSIIRLPHAHLRQVCLSRSLLVIDEVHSSDVYMRTLSRRLLSQHIATGGRALLLSATLGSAARAEYFSLSKHTTLESYEVAVQQAYPSVSSSEQQLKALPSLNKTGKTVQIEPVSCMEKPENLIPALIEAINNNQRVLVILNTVNRAVALSRLAISIPELAKAHFSVNNVCCPHHGRFAQADRKILDKTVTNKMGKKSPKGALLLIGTQTLEQSLDIDADWLISDLCPMDVLLQRIGRLHRHNRGLRPRAVCTVLLPETDDFTTFINQKGALKNSSQLGLGSVYENLGILQLTRNIIAETPTFELPADNRYLVEATTHPEQLSTLKEKKWKEHIQHVEGTYFAKELAANNALIPDKHFGEFVFVNKLEERVVTRLGLDNQHLKLGKTFISPFNQKINELVIPGHLCKKLLKEQADSVEIYEQRLFIKVDDLTLCYSPFGLEIN